MAFWSLLLRFGSCPVDFIGYNEKMTRILLVEDDQFTRELYEGLLKDAGYEVEVAEEGGGGFLKALEGGYELILLDIMLPNKDGIAILRDLKNKPPKKPNKKIVMLTVLDQDEFIKTAFRLGADGYLMKPSLTPDGVLAEIKGFLEEKNNGAGQNNSRYSHS